MTAAPIVQRLDKNKGAILVKLRGERERMAVSYMLGADGVLEVHAWVNYREIRGTAPPNSSISPARGRVMEIGCTPSRIESLDF